MKIYFTKSFANVQLGVGKGKTQYDKREALKRKTHDREIDRALRDRPRRSTSFVFACVVRDERNEFSGPVFKD